MIILARGQTITAGNAAVASIPATLRQQVEASNELLMTPTEIVYRDGRTVGAGPGRRCAPDAAGHRAATRSTDLPAHPGGRHTSVVLRYAVVTTGAILVILLTFIAALVARQVVTPVRAARRAAESLASGNLRRPDAGARARTTWPGWPRR